MALGWAIVGAGRHSDSAMAPAITSADDTELVAVYSRDIGRANEFASRHGAGAAYDSLEALLGDSRVDVVYIASPNHLHAHTSVMAARAGKHILVEKPMAVSVEESVEMVRTCSAQGVKLGVGFHVRHHPGHEETRRLIAEGVLGGVSLVQAHWGFGVRGVEQPPPRTGLSEWWGSPEMVGGASAMMGSGVHAVDILRFLLGREVTEIAAMTDGHTAERPLENLATMCLRFGGGAIAMVSCGRRTPDSKNDITIYGSNGRVYLEDTLRGPLQGNLEVVTETRNSTAAYPRDDLTLFKRQVESFNRSVQEDAEPVASGVDGLRVVEVTVAMIESAKTGRLVKLDPVSV